jgi:hypothetical protein
LANYTTNGQEFDLYGVVFSSAAFLSSCVTYRGIISNGPRSCHPRDPCKGSSGLAISLARKQGVHVQVRAVLQSDIPLVLIITRSRDYYRPTLRATSTYADADLRKFRHNRENGFTSSGASRRLIAALYITGFVYRHLHLVLPSSARKYWLGYTYVESMSLIVHLKKYIVPSSVDVLILN